MDSGDPGNQYRMTRHGSSYPQTVYWLRVSGVWNYPIRWAYIKCSRSPRNTSSSSFLSARQITQNRKLSKIIPSKNASQYPWRSEEMRDLFGLKELAPLWRIGAPFIGTGEICESILHAVTCLASLHVRKQHRINNEPQNRIKWPWIEPKLHRKSNNMPKFT